MTPPPDAFLSYTRLDDECFGGAITSLRRLLELGVQVVTGDWTFNIFQDLDGTEFAQNGRNGMSPPGRISIPDCKPFKKWFLLFVNG